jgi:DNA-binding NarL/FixJ family response regulator
MGAISRLRLLVAGDDDLALGPLCRRIASWPSIEIVGWARSTQEAKSLADELAPDVVLIDLEAPAFGGTAAIGRIRARPGAPILLVLTSEDTPGARTESFAAGADGFVTKAEPDEKLHALVSRIRPYL